MLNAMSTPAASRRIPARDDTARRRATPRRPHRVPCQLWLLDTATGCRRVVAGQTVNISDTGFAVQVGEPVTRGTTVEALLLPALAEPLRLDGAVRHIRRVLTGTFELGIETGSITSVPTS